jgi:hypothetical protein
LTCGWDPYPDEGVLTGGGGGGRVGGVNEKTRSWVLGAGAVTEIFMDSLLRDGEDTVEAVLAQGLVTNVGFHQKRLWSHRHTIRAMLAELPDPFHDADIGGGGSFLDTTGETR